MLQPATPSGVGLELALGMQRFWQKSLKASGRASASIVAHTRIEAIDGAVPEDVPVAVGDRGVAHVGNWSDARAVATMVLAHSSRWGLISTFAPTPSAVRLDTLLIEVRLAEPVRILGRWSFDAGFDALPAHVVEVLGDAAKRVGTRTAVSVQEAFDTDDPGAAMLMLEQMGVLSMAEDGCRLVVAGVLDRLTLLVGAAPRSRVVVALVPELLQHLSRLGAHDIQLARWMKRVQKEVGVLPPEWDGLVQKISRER
ncbi:MAG: hypothetical protein U0234_00585 [Sandaracinus sp.]